jgi:hypothetical protein
MDDHVRRTRRRLLVSGLKRRKPALVQIGVIFALFLLAPAMPASADQWSSTVTVTAAHAEDDANALVIYVMTSQAAANPANCPATDGYETNDPVIANPTLAAALTALSSGTPIQIYVSSSLCVGNRPVILELQVE